MIHADTDGLLDRCHCGAVAGFDADTERTGVMYRARCTECCEQTELYTWQFDAVQAWNLARRAEKAEQTKEGMIE